MLTQYDNINQTAKKLVYFDFGVISKKNSIFKDIIQIEVDPPTLFLTNVFLTKC